MEKLIENGKPVSLRLYGSICQEKLICYLETKFADEIEIDAVERLVREITDGTRKYVSRRIIWNLSMKKDAVPTFVFCEAFRKQLHHPYHDQRRRSKAFVQSTSDELETVNEIQIFDRGLLRHYIEECVDLAKFIIELDNDNQRDVIKGIVSQMRKFRLAYSGDKVKPAVSNHKYEVDTSFYKAYVGLRELVGKQWFFTKSIVKTQVGTTVRGQIDYPYVNVEKRTFQFINKKGIRKRIDFQQGSPLLNHINVVFCNTHNEHLFVYLSGSRAGQVYKYAALSKMIMRLRKKGAKPL